MADQIVTIKAAGGDYTTLAAALAGSASLYGYDSSLWGFDDLVFDCFAGVVDTSEPVISSSWILSNLHWIRVRSCVAISDAPGYEVVSNDGIWDDTKYYLKNPDTTVAALTLQNVYIRLQELQTFLEKKSGSSTIRNIIQSATTAVGPVEMINPLCKVDGVGSSGQQGGIMSSSSNVTYKIINPVVFGNTDHGIELSSTTANEHRIYNATINGSRGMVVNSSQAQVKNSVINVSVAGTAFSGTVDATNSTNNYTNDTTGPGTDATLSCTFSFTDTATGNLKLLSTDTSGALTGGISLNTDADYGFSHDIAYVERETWDAGAYQTTVESTPLPPTDLFVRTHPTNTASGEVMGEIVVEIHNDIGQIVTTETTTITLAWGDNPGGATGPSGTLSKAAVAGVATFDDISTATLQDDATFVFTATGLTSIESNPFDITAVAPSVNAAVILHLGTAMHTTVQKDAVESATTLAYFRLVNTDGTAYTAATGKADISINGGSFAAGANDITHVASGLYKVSLSATERATAGTIVIKKDIGAGVICIPGVTAVIVDDVYTAGPTEDGITDSVWAAETRSLTDKASFTLATAEHTSIRDAILNYDLFGIGHSFLKTIKAVSAVLLGKTGATANTYRNVDDTADVITATVDAETKERTAITIDWDNV